MKKIEKVFDLSNSFDELERVINSSTGLIYCKQFPKKYEIQLTQVNKGIHFNILHDSFIFMHDVWSFKDLILTMNEYKIKIPHLFINQKKGGLAKGKISSFEYKKFDKKKRKYHRLVLPIPIDTKLDFVFSVENILIKYKYDEIINTSDATEVVINDNIFHLFLAKKTITEPSNRDFLVLESTDIISFTSFSEFCFSILLTFGFISGDFVNNDGYFFQYDSEEMNIPTGFAYKQMRGSIKSSYVPVYSNPFGYIHDIEIANLFKDKVRTLNLIEFSKLCQYCHTNNDIKTIILLILEAQTQSLVSGPGILSITLETLSNVIYEENESKLAPIKSKSISKKLRKELTKVINSFENEIDNEGREILTARIEQINQRTNRDKLLIPFQILDIPLSNVDIAAIEQRNAFLHGRTPMLQDNASTSINEEDKFRYYLFLKLYVLICAVILKYCGFNNLIVNYPKIYEKTTGVNLDENHYRQI